MAASIANTPIRATLAWVAGIAADEAEDWDLRLSCSNTLLDFPRTEHRALLEGLAARQTGFHVHFDTDDVQHAYATSADDLEWRRRDDPWKFYEPEAIAARQERRGVSVSRIETTKKAIRLSRMAFCSVLG